MDAIREDVILAGASRVVLFPGGADQDDLPNQGGASPAADCRVGGSQEAALLVDEFLADAYWDFLAVAYWDCQAVAFLREVECLVVRSREVGLAVLPNQVALPRVDCREPVALTVDPAENLSLPPPPGAGRVEGLPPRSRKSFNWPWLGRPAPGRPKPGVPIGRLPGADGRPVDGRPAEGSDGLVDGLVVDGNDGRVEGLPVDGNEGRVEGLPVDGGRVVGRPTDGRVAGRPADGRLIDGVRPTDGRDIDRLMPPPPPIRPPPPRMPPRAKTSAVKQSAAKVTIAKQQSEFLRRGMVL